MGRLVNALQQQFQGAQRQRCQAPFMRDVLGAAARHARKALADKLKLIFIAADENTAHKLANGIIAELESKAGKAMETLQNGLDSALNVLNFPKRYHKRLRTINLAERVNEEIRRRQRVIRIFPNDEAAERLICALSNDFYEDWQESIRYLNMAEHWDWRKENPHLLGMTLMWLR